MLRADWLKWEIGRKLTPGKPGEMTPASWAGGMIASLLRSPLSVYSLTGGQAQRAAALSEDLKVGLDTAIDVIVSKDLHATMPVDIGSDDMEWDAGIVNEHAERLGWGDFRCKLYYPRQKATGVL